MKTKKRFAFKFYHQELKLSAIPLTVCMYSYATRTISVDK